MKNESSGSGLEGAIAGYHVQTKQLEQQNHQLKETHFEVEQHEAQQSRKDIDLLKSCMPSPSFTSSTGSNYDALLTLMLWPWLLFIIHRLIEEIT